MIWKTFISNPRNKIRVILKRSILDIRVFVLLDMPILESFPHWRLNWRNCVQKTTSKKTFFLQNKKNVLVYFNFWPNHPFLMPFYENALKSWHFQLFWYFLNHSRSCSWAYFGCFQFFQSFKIFVKIDIFGYGFWEFIIPTGVHFYVLKSSCKV